MIELLNKNDLNRITELENNFNYVLKNVESDLVNNPFSKYLLFIEHGKILGYINYYLMYEKIEIANFDVLLEYQNNGVGTKLLTYLINEYQGKVENITLEVKCDNAKAIHLYKKMGFKDVSIRKNYYDGVDGILMELMMK